MSAVAFETLKFVEKLEAGGFSSAQAKAAALGFCRSDGRTIGYASGFAGGKSRRITVDLTALKADLRQVELRSLRRRDDLVEKWTLGLVVAGIFGLGPEGVSPALTPCRELPAGVRIDPRAEFASSSRLTEIRGRTRLRVRRRSASKPFREDQMAQPGGNARQDRI
jgi:hypothetical protein